MSRLLGIISSETSSFDRYLLSTPASLPSLASIQPDGWGIAVHDGPGGWRIETRDLGESGGRPRATAAPGLQGAVLIAYVRNREDVAAAQAAAQPLRDGRWGFACDGEIGSPDYLLAHTSPHRLAGRAGNTESDLLFAYLLSELDRADATESCSTERLDALVKAAVADLAEHVGPTSFLLSDGTRLYAHRRGPPLGFVERRGPGAAIVVASEALTDEAWCAVDEGSLLRWERSSGLTVAFLRGTERPAPSKYDLELPCTD